MLRRKSERPSPSGPAVETVALLRHCIFGQAWKAGIPTHLSHRADITSVSAVFRHGDCFLCVPCALFLPMWPKGQRLAGSRNSQNAILNVDRHAQVNASVVPAVTMHSEPIHPCIWKVIIHCSRLSLSAFIWNSALTNECAYCLRHSCSVTESHRMGGLEG